MNTISTDDLRTMKSLGKPFALVNVLPEASFKETSIPGAVNIPLDDPAFATRVQQLLRGKSDAVIVYCASDQCPASTEAAETLERAGFTNVMDYKGGAQAWLQESTRVPVA